VNSFRTAVSSRNRANASRRFATESCFANVISGSANPRSSFDFASVVSIAFPWGFSPHPLLSRLRDAALDRGIPVLSLYDPLLPDEINHLNFPSLSLSVVSGPAERPSEVIDLRDALSLSGEQPFNRDAHDLLLKRAVECLRDAKRRHDDLEKYYVEAMDYAAWQAALDRMKEAIGAMAAT